MSAAEQAVRHVVGLLQIDSRLAFLIGPGSPAFELLTDAMAELDGHDLALYRDSLAEKLTVQPVPGIGSHGAVLDPEVLARIAEYDKHVHDLDDQDDQDDLNMLANHFLRRGLDVAEAERDTITEELF